jgi:hypothetical protein
MHDTRTTETQGNHDLFDAFAESGCPICILALRAVSRYMGATNYDSLGDPAIRKQFEASMGFCNRHAHRWLEEAFILGTAQMYRDVLLNIRSEVHARSWRGAGLARRVGSLLGARKGDAAADDPSLRPTAACPACAIHDETESRLLKTLLKGLAEPQFQEAFAQSDGLCLPHLRRALRNAPRQETFDALRERALQTEELLLSHLEETIRKHDYRYSHEPPGEEKGSPARAVAHVAGQDGALGAASS